MPLIILNFHGVGPVPRSIDDGERKCWLDHDFFEAVLDLVQNEPQVRLTVDDGNRSDFEIVLPALRRRGLKATFFVCSGRLDQPAFLSRAQVRELLAQGMGVGSHGIAHRSWRRLPSADLREEIAGSRRVLEAICGIAVDTAACPFGDYDRAVLKGLRQAGYRRVYTSDGGVSAEEQWLLPRTTMTRAMTMDDLQRLVQRGPGLWEQFSTDARKLVKRLR